MKRHIDLEQEIERLLAIAEAVTLQRGTMDIAKLERAVEAMREGLSQAELNAIADAMDEE